MKRSKIIGIFYLSIIFSCVVAVSCVSNYAPVPQFPDRASEVSQCESCHLDAELLEAVAEEPVNEENGCTGSEG